MSAGSTPHTVVVGGALGQPEHLRRPYYRITAKQGRERVVFRSSDDQLSIGSHPGNQLLLPDVAVSRFHARLELDAIGYRLVDLESTNGTFVEGLRIGAVYLQHKAKLRFGTVEAVFEIERDAAMLGLQRGERFGAVIGQHPLMRRLFDQLEQVSPTDATVLLLGETGVGKDLIAQEIHRHSPRANQPFVVVDCGSLPEALIDSELFGHERGAFTGAERARAGAFEEAHGGTLFLDEIGELALPLQVKLLRALEQRQTKRLGSDTWRAVNVRVIAATHRDLPRMCNQHLFREDLYYRVSVVSLKVPPLRDRAEDLPLLVASLLADEGGQLALDPGLLSALAQRRWAGNVRELRNVLERARVLGPGALGDDESARPTGGAPEEEPYKIAKARAIEGFERSYLEALLLRHHGNVAQAARAGAVDPAWIFRLLKRYQIDVQSLRKRG